MFARGRVRHRYRIECIHTAVGSLVPVKSNANELFECEMHGDER